MKKIYTRFFIISLAMLIFASDGFSQKSILFVGRYDEGYWQSDVDIQDSLRAWGYLPEFWNSVDYNTGLGLDYNMYDGMVINETVDSKVLGRFGTTDGYPLPCVNMEGFCVAPADSDRWGWIDDLGTELYQVAFPGGTADEQVFVIKDNSHYITEIFQVGDEITWSTTSLAGDIEDIRNVSIKEVNVTYSAKLGQIKAHQDQSDFWNMVTVDDMDGSGNRMVFWGLHNSGLNGAEVVADPLFSHGSPEFFTLLKRAVEWSLREDGGGTGVEPVEVSRLELVAFPNPATERVTVRFRATMPGESVATLYNMAGQQVDMFLKSTVEGNNFFFLDAGDYPAGIYHLHLDLEGESAVTKVVIQ